MYMILICQHWHLPLMGHYARHSKIVLIILKALVGSVITDNIVYRWYNLQKRNTLRIMQIWTIDIHFNRIFNILMCLLMTMLFRSVA